MKLSPGSSLERNRSMPPGVIIPELAYPDVRQAVDWLCRSFGFVERLRIGNHRAQLSFGEGSIIVTAIAAPQSDDVDAAASGYPVSPLVPSGRFTHSIMVCVADVDSHYARAKQSGAEIISPPADYPYGERQYTVDDLAGHRWTFSQTIMDIDPGTWGGILFE